MPANLSPEFLKARERFRASETTEDKLAALEEMLATIPKHKGTDKMQADIKRRIAKLRDAETHRKKGRSSSPDRIERSGAGQVVLVGPPNSGKSSLLAAMTNAHPQVGEYPYSTVVAVPGMTTFEDVPIQLVDLPPVCSEFTEVWVYNVVRESDLVLLTIDGTSIGQHEKAIDELRTLLDDRHIELAREPRESDDFRVKVVPTIVAATKTDLVDTSSLPAVPDSSLPLFHVSAETKRGLEDLKRGIFDSLRIIRIYTKLPGKSADLAEPYTLPIGSTALDAARAVHGEFADKLKYTRVWGSSKFDGQQVPLDFELQDRDVIEIHLN